MKLNVELEINGSFVKTGTISGGSYTDASFSYLPGYLESEDPRAISVALPLRHESFTPKETAVYFEGLLPEGFSRQAVAEWLSEDERDYTSILHGLGRECLGAVRITNDEDVIPDSSYKRLSMDEVVVLAKEGASKSTELLMQTHLSLAGATGKAGLYTNDAGSTWFLPVGTAPSTHIVKQSHVRLEDIVINEYLSLLTASELGIETAESFIITPDANDRQTLLLSSKRYDRKDSMGKKTAEGFSIPCRLHQEDFAQALGIPSSEKYEKNSSGYMAAMFDLIRRVSTDPVKDMSALWDRIVFNYLIGNTDAHIKNYSLLYDVGLSAIRLAPAYDILCTVYYRQSTGKMAFSIGGESDLHSITDLNFEKAAKDAGMGAKFAMNRYRSMKNDLPGALKHAAEKLSDEGFPEADRVYKRMKEIIAELCRDN